MPRSRDRTLAVTLGLLTLLFYGFLLIPGLAPGDSAEFQRIAGSFEYAHQPGYPTYLLLSWLPASIPIGEPAWRMNLFSAVAAAFCGAMLFLLARRFSLSLAASFAIAILFATGQTMMSQSIVAEVYALNMLFLVVCLYLTVAYVQSRDRRHLWCLAVVYALALGHHLTMGLLLPLFLITIWRHTSPRTRRDLLRPALLCFALTLGVYAYSFYCFLRVSPAGFWDTLVFTLAYSTGAGFRGSMFAYSPGQIPMRLAMFVQLFVQEFSWIAVPFFLWGLRPCSRRPGGGLVLAIFIVITLLVMNYGVSDIESFFLPSFLTGAIIIGFGVDGGSSWLARRFARPTLPTLQVLLASILLVPLPFLDRPLATRLRESARQAESRPADLLAGLPSDSVLVLGWNTYTVLKYIQDVRHQGRSLTLVLGHPMDIDVFARRILSAGRTLYFETRPDLDPKRFRLEPILGLYRVVARPD